MMVHRKFDKGLQYNNGISLNPDVYKEYLKTKKASTHVDKSHHKRLALHSNDLTNLEKFDFLNKVWSLIDKTRVTKISLKKQR